MIRGGGFDRLSERTLSLQFGNCPPDLVQKACEALAPKSLNLMQTYPAVFHLFPFYPITLKLWFADERSLEAEDCCWTEAQNIFSLWRMR